MSDSATNVDTRSATAVPPIQTQATALDPGLAGLALVAAYYRIAADPLQLRHQLALTGRLAEAEDLVRGANLLGLKSRRLKKARRLRAEAAEIEALYGDEAS